MKKILMGGVAALAFAAHLSTATPSQAADPFAGWYVGGHGMFGGADLNSLADGTDANPTMLGDTDGFGGGFHVGYNHFVPLAGIEHFLFGFEGDFTLLDMESEDRTPKPAYSEADINLLSSMRARLGVAIDPNVLVYVTAGVGMVDWDYTANSLSSNIFGSNNYFDVGHVFGAGVEFAAFGFMNVRIEGLYYGFGAYHTDRVNGTSDTGDFAELDDIYALRVGASIPLNRIFSAFGP